MSEKFTDDLLTIYNTKDGFKSLGWSINSSILKGANSETLYVPAGLLCINNNFECKKMNSSESGVVDSDLFDSFYNCVVGKKMKHNKTRRKKQKLDKKQRKRKRKNKTKRY